MDLSPGMQGSFWDWILLQGVSQTHPVSNGDFEQVWIYSSRVLAIAGRKDSSPFYILPDLSDGTSTLWCFLEQLRNFTASTHIVFVSGQF